MFIRFIYLLIIISTCFSCFKEQTADPATLYSNPEFVIKISNGQTFQYQQTIEGVIVDARSQYTGSENYELCSFIKKDSKVNESFTISLSKIFYNAPSQYQIDSLFGLGNRYQNFSPPYGNQVSVQMEHFDSAGIKWSTLNGTEHAGSYFQILGSELSAGPGYRYKVRGRFTCNLYNIPLNYKQYSGEFVCKFGAGNY